MEDFLVRKIYIDSRFKTASSASDSNFSVVLPEIVNLPEKCIGVIDEIILPVMFHNVERDFNDKLYIGIYYEQTTNYYTITIESKNYTLPDLADMLKSALNLVDPTHVLFEVYALADAMILSIEWVDQRVDPLDVITITVLDDNELKAGSYNNTPISQPESMNDILQNYKKEINDWNVDLVQFYPDLHPIRNLYLCCSELSSYSSLTNFDWHGSNIIKKIPINVPFGSMVYNFQSITFDHFNCGNLTLNKLSFTLRNSHGKIVNLNNHWSFSILFSRDHN